MQSAELKRLAAECGFELAGVASATSLDDFALYERWVGAGMAGAMGYLSDRRAEMRRDPRSLLASARSIVCVGKLYNVGEPYSTCVAREERGWISRYAWGDDYHAIIRRGLERLVELIRVKVEQAFEYKIAVDTAPLLERSYARQAGLGWIGKNTCLINQQGGSWFFLGELLLSLELEPDTPPPDRCGKCTRCIDACPTEAIVPTGCESAPWTLDARRCISYFTIELRGSVPEEHRAEIGNHLFGCDICQDVCPWNRRAAIIADSSFAARNFAPPLERLAELSEAEFRDMFRDTPVTRARYSGFLRNVALAMGNSGEERFREPLERLAAGADPLVAGHARWALAQLRLQADASPAALPHLSADPETIS
jgi:epoxyqueuosine reductase